MNAQPGSLIVIKNAGSELCLYTYKDDGEIIRMNSHDVRGCVGVLVDPDFKSIPYPSPTQAFVYVIVLHGSGAIIGSIEKEWIDVV